MKQSSISRKDFLKNSALGFAGLTFISSAANAQYGNEAYEENKNGKMEASKNYIIKNVLLETGFEYEGDDIVATKTELFSIEIENGKIKDIKPNQPDANAIDAKGMLMLPSFKDMHIHLDKTFYGDRWQAVRKRTGGVKGMIALEQQMLPEMLKNSTYKAEKLIELLQSNGTSFARSHVNIEQTSKLDSLKNLQIALANKKDVFGLNWWHFRSMVYSIPTQFLFSRKQLRPILIL